jgi:hypothetical protein
MLGNVRSNQERDQGDASKHTDGGTSPPCFLHEVDPVYLGYWSYDETLLFLDKTLETVRAAARAFSRMIQDSERSGRHRIIAGDEISACLVVRYTLAEDRGAKRPCESANRCVLRQVHGAARASATDRAHRPWPGAFCPQDRENSTEDFRSHLACDARRSACVTRRPIGHLRLLRD